MSAWLDDGDVRLYHGDALEQLALMSSESVHCIVTSPPFFGLRDYGMDGQIGLEESPSVWCDALVAVFREARRVLRSDGVMWLEVGDAYAGGGRANQGNNGGIITGKGPRHGGDATKSRRRDSTSEIKHKDLVGAPWLLAFALRADGWYLRSDTIWARPNPMPESVTDRPTKAHSYVFLLTKSAKYAYDADAIRETAQDRPQPAPEDKTRDANGTAWLNNRYAPGPSGYGHNPAGRNARSVQTWPTEPTPFAHFATFPQALVAWCIKAGTSERGACSECGAPWRRITERTIENPGNRSNNGRYDGNEKLRRGFEVRREVSVATTGWEPSCACHDVGGPLWNGLMPTQADTTPCVVLDPFSGSGTTALVARRLGRHAVGIELNEDYLRISATRLQQLSLFGGTA